MSSIVPADVAVVGPDPLWVVDHMNRLHHRLRGAHVRDFSTVVEALDNLAPGHAAVLLCSPAAATDALAILADLATRRPELGVIATVDAAVEDTATAAIEQATGRAAIGADDAEAIVDAVRNELARRHRGLPPGPAGGSVELSGQDPRQVAAAHGLGTEAALIVVTAGKGGTGATTVAINIAAALAASQDGTVALVDAHGHRGDVGLLLGLPVPEHRDLDELDLDANRIQRLIVPHDASGIRVVALPTDMHHFASIGVRLLFEVLLALESAATFVVVDAPLELVAEAGLAPFASTVVLVTTSDLTALKDTRLAADRLDHDERLVVVANLPAPREDDPDEGDLAHTLGLPVLAVLPHDTHLARSADQREPITIAPDHSGLAKRVGRLAHGLWGRAARHGA